MLKFSEKSDSKTDTEILLDAISKDKVHLARFILDALDGKIVDAKTEGDHTPLISSVFLQDACARAKFMNLLLQRGANVNQQDECGRTAFSHACEKGYLDAVKTLVQNNADPEIIDTWGNTALMYAAAAGHSVIVEFLVRAFKRLGLQIDRQNKVGNSALHVAKYLGHTECLSALMCSSKKAHDWDPSVDGLDVLRADEDVDVDALVKVVKKNTGAQNVGRRKFSNLWSRMMSMDSIDEQGRDAEFDKDRWPTSSQGYALTPKLPHRCRVTQTLKQVAENCMHGHLPPPSGSPRPSTNFADSPGPLSILLTPIRAANTNECAISPRLYSARFDDNYYRKRCSLPTSALSLAPPERSATSMRKTKPAPKDLQDPPNTAFSALSNRLLRRFTLPELKKSAKEVRGGTRTRNEDGESAPVGLPRSETFPLDTNHPQVGSKPSIDSISAVTCEFDFQLKTSKAHI